MELKIGTKFTEKDGSGNYIILNIVDNIIYFKDETYGFKDIYEINHFKKEFLLIPRIYEVW